MDITPKRISYEKNITETINYYLEDDQLRLLFIVILVIGLILLLSGIKGAAVFLIIGFGLIAFMCVFKPSKPNLLENFVCDSLMMNIQSTLDDLEVEHQDHTNSRIGISMICERNCQIKFRNSSRNKK
jgi:hypothetical protein